MKKTQLPSLLSLAAITLGISSHADAAGGTIQYNDGITNTQNASGPSWVSGTAMFREIISDYGGSPSGPSGASGASQTGFTIFDTTYDITLLSWEIGSLTLFEGAGSVTLSPGPATPGAEDYRYAGLSDNLTFFYNGVEWASGKLTRFITSVDNDADVNATGEGEAMLASNTAAGLDFFNEIMGLSGGTGKMSFIADSFFAISATDPGTFGSAGSISVVPEPSAWGALLGTAVLGLACIQRRRRL